MQYGSDDMARINAILKINELGNGILENFDTSQNSNNVSYTPYSNSFLEFINDANISNKTYGATGTLFGLTNTIGDLRFGVVDNNGVRSENYKGMMLGYTNNSNIFLCELIVTGQDITQPNTLPEDAKKEDSKYLSNSNKNK